MFFSFFLNGTLLLWLSFIIFPNNTKHIFLYVMIMSVRVNWSHVKLLFKTGGWEMPHSFLEPGGLARKQTVPFCIN